MMASLTEPATVLAWTMAGGDKAASTLFELDATLGAILRSTTEPMVGQMRLAWWREALRGLDIAPAPAEPVLTALSTEVLPRGISGGALSASADGWEILLTSTMIDGASLDDYAAGRGTALFRALARVRRVDPRIAELAGRGWALADLATHTRETALQDRAARSAADTLAALPCRFARADRLFAAFAIDARMALAGQGIAGGPRRAARILRLLLTGR